MTRTRSITARKARGGALVQALAAALLSAFVVPATAGAVTFSSSLGSVKINAKPGQIVTRQFELTLTPDQPRTAFRARVEDWWRSEDGRESFFDAPGTLQRSCGPWVTINPVDEVVGGGETLRIRLTAAVPRELAPGGYWCVLTVDEQPDPLQAQDGVAMRFLASVSTGIFIYVDPVTRSARIVDVELIGDTLRITVENAGNAPLGAEGRVEFLRSGEVEPVAVATFPRTTVLPEPITRSILTADLPKATVLPAGRYVVRVVLDIGLDHYIGVQKELYLPRGASVAAP